MVDWKHTSSRELALISIFSALWIAAQYTLGPIIGRFSIGPISMHGVVNRVVGWTLMLILANLSGKFGRVSLMAFVASLATRLIRLSPLTGLVVGFGYFLGGLLFDVLFFGVYSKINESHSGVIILVAASFISGTLAMAPYVLFKFLILNWEAFVVLSPVYAISTAKGTIFSLIGTYLGLLIIPRIKMIT